MSARVRFIDIAVIAVLAVLVGTALYIAVDGCTSRPARADVAIVFGNTVEPSGRLSPRLRARLDRARELYAAGLVSAIIVSGAIGREGVDEASAMGAYLERHGVPIRLIQVDHDGGNTALTCAHSADYMRARRLTSAVPVSQWFHLTRAKLACRRAGIRVAGAAAARYWEPRDAYSLAREVIGVYAYGLAPKS